MGTTSKDEENYRILAKLDTNELFHLPASLPCSYAISRPMRGKVKEKNKRFIISFSYRMKQLCFGGGVFF